MGTNEVADLDPIHTGTGPNILTSMGTDRLSTYTGSAGSAPE